MRPDLWRSMTVAIEALPAPRTRLGRRSFLGLGAALTGSLALGAKTGQRRTRDRLAAGGCAMVAIDRPRRGRPALWQARRHRGRRHPAQRAVAHRRHRILHQLFAAAGSARHHHAERPVLRALSCRTAGRRSGSAPADDPRPGRASAGPHHEGHRALSVGVAHPFHRMPGQWRHGMARRAVQLAAVQPRHDQLRGMDRRAGSRPCWKKSASRRKRSGRWSKAPTART